MRALRVTRAYKTERDLNTVQVTACKRHAGAARYAYNWGLRRKQDVYEATGKRPSAIDLHHELNALKKTELPWMYAVSKCAPQEALCAIWTPPSPTASAVINCNRMAS
jgi:putative transposase